MRPVLPLLVALLALPTGYVRAADSPAVLAQKAQAILKANCHRCHGQNGSLEGGFNYILDHDQAAGPQKGAARPARPVAALQTRRRRQDAARRRAAPALSRRRRPAPALDRGRRSRRLSAGGGAASHRGANCRVDPGRSGKNGQTQPPLHPLLHPDHPGQRRGRARRTAILSQRPRQAAQQPLLAPAHQPAEARRCRRGWCCASTCATTSGTPTCGTGSWPTIPTASSTTTAVARAVLVEHGHAHAGRARSTGSSPRPRARRSTTTCCKSRPTCSELERQLRVDVAQDIQQERVARAGFIGSGISRNNRILERHDAQNGAYWRTYDFDAIPQNLTDRDLLLPDRRNVFAYPLGPGLADNAFQHAGGEIIFNLPNGLHGLHAGQRQ